MLDRIRSVGSRLIAAQPRELVIGNIVRRVLGLVREVDEQQNGTVIGDAGGYAGKPTSPLPPHGHPQHHPHHHARRSSSHFSSLATTSVGLGGQSNATVSSDQLRRPSLQRTGTATPAAVAPNPLYSQLFPSTKALSSTNASPESHDAQSRHQTSISPLAESLAVPGGSTNSAPQNLDVKGPSGSGSASLKADVLEGIRELLDEVDQVHEQIAAYALEHIHSDEIILTYSASATVQRFLLAAAKKRRFTVIYAESYPNNHHDTHSMVLHGHTRRKGVSEASTGGDFDDDDDTDGNDSRFRPLTSAGITVILIPDSAIFAVMSRVNTVIFAAQSVLANGGVVAAAGSSAVAQAAAAHRTPVVVVAGVYKLSPLHSFQQNDMFDEGDPGVVLPFSEGELVELADVINPLLDYVPPEQVDLYITNT